MNTTDTRAMLRACHKDVRPFLRDVMEAGGTVRLTKGNHVMVRLGQTMITLSLTPRTPNASITELKKLLRRQAA